MNEFLEQFLIEAKDLVVQATDDLLALEAEPDDPDRIDSAFRAFHTLKGAGGIIEFPPMVRALHAAEDLLARARSGDARLDPDRIGECLTAIDQVVQWMDVMEQTGELPTGADAEADAVVARFVHAAAAAATPAAVQSAAGEAQDWLAALLARGSSSVETPSVAIRYRPDPGCFFQGEDPLAMVSALPGLTALTLSPVSPWPDLGDVDPFTCNIEIAALSTATPEEAKQAFGGAVVDAEFVDLGRGGSGLPLDARAIIEAQIALLESPLDDGAAGRVGSAGRTATNVLRSLGLHSDADQVTVEAGDPPQSEALTTALRRLLAPAAQIAPARADPQPRQEAAARSLRVDVDRIDALVRLTGELTVIKNALGHIAGLAQAGAAPDVLSVALQDQHALLGRLVDDLQHSVLSIRVLPMLHVFQRFPRLVRDLAAKLGKPVRLVIEGEETEADKTIVEGLFEPLLHVLRNALDHGIEPPAVRMAAGKAAQGVIHLRAFRQGANVFVEIEDDGGGVDLDRVREAAVSRGVASAQTLAAMTSEQITDLIFAAGFSTASAVSDVSGRGVGMDAVRAAVTQMGGWVQVESRPGEGTLLRLVLPFTLMMTAVMTVEVGGQVFGLALDTVVETLRAPRAEISTIGAARAFAHRGRTIPLVDLSVLLGSEAIGPTSPEVTVVVTSVAGQLVGLEVDRLGGRMDVMLKPMEGLLAGMTGISGTTLLGDGRVMIVLDLPELLS